MSSMFTVYQTRGNAIAAMMVAAKAQPTIPITVYCVPQAPAMYLVGYGKDHDSMIESGAQPVFTFTAHLPPQRLGEGMRVWSDLEEEAV